MWTLKAHLCRAFCVHLVRVSVRLLEAVVAVPLEKTTVGAVSSELSEAFSSIVATFVLFINFGLFPCLFLG